MKACCIGKPVCGKIDKNIHITSVIYVDDHNLCEEGIGGLDSDSDVAVHRVDDVAELGVHLRRVTRVACNNRYNKSFESDGHASDVAPAILNTGKMSFLSVE